MVQKTANASDDWEFGPCAWQFMTEIFNRRRLFLSISDMDTFTVNLNTQQLTHLTKGSRLATDFHKYTTKTA